MSATRPSPRLTRGPVVAGCVLGATLALGAAGRPWAYVDGPALSGIAGSMTGRALAPVVGSSALAALAAAAALLATRGVLRRVVGGLLVVLGVAVVLGGVLGTGEAHVSAVAGLEHAGDVRPTAWPWVSHLGGLVVVASGLSAVSWSHQWPVTARRYDVPPGGGPREVAVVSGPEGLWAALDRGDDPTSDPTPDRSPGSGEPGETDDRV